MCVYVCAFGPSQLWIFNASLILTKRPARQLMEDVLGVLASLVKNFSFEISSLQIYDKRNLFFCFFPLQSLLDFASSFRVTRLLSGSQGGYSYRILSP